MLVSVNGDFSPPNGLAFELGASGSADTLHAAFSASSGAVEYNFGEDGRELAHRPPSEAFEAMARVGGGEGGADAE
eukprot:2180570-Rhodomonas_salina.1